MFLLIALGLALVFFLYGICMSVAHKDWPAFRLMVCNSVIVIGLFIFCLISGAI